MTAIAGLMNAASATFPPTALSAASGVRFETFHDLAAVESLWRTMEAQGLSSPYQRFDWVHAYVEALAVHEGFEPRVILLRDAADRPLLLLPLAVRRRGGFRIASMIGGKQANYHLPLMASHAPPPSADALKPVLAAAGRRLGIDAYDLANLPRLWHGRPNPLFQPAARPNPSDSHVLTLGRDAEETLKGVLDKNARKKIRQKERYLAALGPVVHRVARSPAEVDRILDAYVAQKTARFRALGLPADIERAPMRAFLRQGCLAGLEAGCPAIELHALEVGDRIAATFGAAVDRLRASGMFISFDGAADLARCSPGDLLVARV